MTLLMRIASCKDTSDTFVYKLAAEGGKKVTCRLHVMPCRPSLLKEDTDVTGYRCFVVAYILKANVEVLFVPVVTFA